MPDERHKRSESGHGATWSGTAPTAADAPEPETSAVVYDAEERQPAVEPKRPAAPVLPREEPGRQQRKPGVHHPRQAARTDEGGVTGVLIQLGEVLIDAGGFLVERVLRPSRNALKTLRDRVSGRHPDRLVDSDTFDRKRAEDWEKFRKGKTSSSYLQDDQ